MSMWDYWSKRRRDKGGGYARTRRYEKRLERRGLREVSVAVASITRPDRMSDGKGALTIYRDVVRRLRRRNRRPDRFTFYQHGAGD